MLIWSTNELPKPTNGINRLCRQMNGFGELPLPMDKIADLYRKAIKRKLNNVKCDLKYGANILFGNLHGGYVSFNNSYILDYAPIYFGNQVLIGPDCKLITSWHPENNLHEVRAKEIIIGNNVWLTMNVIILPGVTIGDNVIIGAGSIVTKSIPNNVIAAGNPARVIKNRSIKF